MEESYKKVIESKFELPFGGIFTFEQLFDLKKVKQEVSELWKDHSEIWEYTEKLRMAALQYNRPELFEQWKKDNLRTTLGFPTLKQLREDIGIKFCLYCGEPMEFKRSTKKYCGVTCVKRAYRKRKKLRESKI
ncbi:unnamed protein product [marine sediment metagenome]|uniref:Uncharacterized protein n=1 Tax=marine sediment metagenome TaxID=412755 RepID=X1FR88_9ZZZZ